MQIVLLIFSATFLQCYFMHKTLRKTEAQLSNACLPYVKWSETRLSCKQHQDISMLVSTSTDQSVALCPSFQPVTICKVIRQVIKVCPHTEEHCGAVKQKYVEQLHFCIDL